eukprot:1159426-Pelagomonas_calceolata.AAC.6
MKPALIDTKLTYATQPTHQTWLRQAHKCYESGTCEHAYSNGVQRIRVGSKMRTEGRQAKVTGSSRLCGPQGDV